MILFHCFTLVEFNYNRKKDFEKYKVNFASKGLYCLEVTLLGTLTWSDKTSELKVPVRWHSEVAVRSETEQS